MSIPVAQDAVTDIGSTLIHFAIAWMVLETLFVGLWYVATYLKPYYVVGVDDVAMPLALVFNIGFCILCILTVTQSSVGHYLHWVQENRPAGIVAYHKQQVVYLMLYALACTFSKLAILGLYQRIFVSQRDRMISYALMAILSLWAISAVVADLLQCIPLAYLWNPEGYPNGHCFNITEYTKWLSFPNILTDVAILLLPFPCIWKLQLPRRIKVGLAITFCTGSVGLITSIVRFATFFSMAAEREVDFPYISVKLTYVSIAESGLYLIAACLPNYRSLFRIVQRHICRNDGTKTDMHSQRTPVRSIFLSNRDGKDFDGSHGFSRIDSNGTAATSDKTLSPNKILVESRFEMASFVESDRDPYSPTVGCRSWE